MRSVEIISIESDFGAGKKGAKLGPQALIRLINKNNIPHIAHAHNSRIVADDLEENIEHPFNKNIESIYEVQQLAVDAIENTLSKNLFPFIISGDHSNGCAGISAVKNFYSDKRIGIVWIDAHADLHSPYSTPSGNMHGMPLAAALAVNDLVEDANEVDEESIKLWQSLVHLGSKKIAPKILPSDLIFIDLRDFEEDEQILLNNKHITYFTPQIRTEIGIETILNKTLAQLSECDLIYVSFDVDSLDPNISIGTGTPVPNGLSEDEAVFLLKNLINNPKTVAFEITEINPLLDREHPMEDVATRILGRIFA
ncbi:MAG: arginase [Bacteroidota bacterium]